MPVRVFRAGAFSFPLNFFQKILNPIGINFSSDTQWQIRCAFNGYCKRSLQNEMPAAKRDLKRRQRCKVTFSDLTPQEEKQLCTYDQYFVDDEAEKSFVVARKEITAKLLAEALHSLPNKKRKIKLPYYFERLKDVGIGKLLSTIQYRQTSFFKLLYEYRSRSPPKKFGFNKKFIT